jgi:hypothetical protein
VGGAALGSANNLVKLVGEAIKLVDGLL